MSDHEKFMKRAIELSKKAGIIDKSGGVFGAVVVKDGKIIAEGWNRVAGDHDATCHAEVDAIRKACKSLGTPHLEGCTLYTSAYCCPMCLCAAYWAHIKNIYYAATVEDSMKYGGFMDVDYFKEMALPTNKRKIPMQELCRPEAVAIWQEFSKMPNRAQY